jgi:hypothetical protein
MAALPFLARKGCLRNGTLFVLTGAKPYNMKASLLLGAVLISTISFAQTGFRVQGAINRSNISVENNGRVNEANTLSSFSAGLIADFRLGGPVYLQTGLLYSGKGSKVENGTQGSANYLRQTFNPFYLELPVNAVVKFPLGTDKDAPRLFVGAGPYVAMGIRGKSTTEGAIAGASFSGERDIRFSNDDPTTFNTEEGAGFGVVRRFDYGLNATAGLEVSKLVLFTNYGHGLAKLQSGTSSGTDNNNKFRIWSFGVGLKF